MTTAPVLIWKCGCCGPAFNDDYANVYIRPDKNKCVCHARDDVKRVYECGCFVKDRIVHGWVYTIVHDTMRCPGHDVVRMRDAVPPTGSQTFSCGCVGREIAVVSDTQRALYFVAAYDICIAHKSECVTGALVLYACGCVLIGINKPAPCAAHVDAAAMRYSDPFMKPSDKPVVQQSKSKA